MITAWFIVIGALLILMALVGSEMEHLPISTGLIYLILGVVLGPSGFGLLDPDPLLNAHALEFAFELAVLVSLFTVGLKLRAPFLDGLWRLPVALAINSMVITIVCVAALAIWVMDLSLGAAILLGAILAPTDPVLASDVQTRDPDDRDDLRFGLTAEGGLNDGTAFPFVFLGLGLLGLHELGVGGWRWVAMDLVWGAGGGLLVGALSGLGVGRLIVWLRQRRPAPYELEEFLTLGLIALSYGLALLLNCLGFLSVLAAGLAMRRSETQSSAHDVAPPKRQAAAEAPSEPNAIPSDATAPCEPVVPSKVVQSVLGFNQRFERIAEVAAVLLLGSLLSEGYYAKEGIWVGLFLICIVRPLSVWFGTLHVKTDTRKKVLVGWFGVRGVGSLYYLMFAINAGVTDRLAETLLSLVLTVVALSIVIHGVSSTPLMALYQRGRGA